MEKYKSCKELGLDENEVKRLATIIHASNPLVFQSCEEVAKDILLAGYKLQKGKGICACGSINDITFESDPYESEINDNDEKVWQCKKCREISAAEI